jgi:hypothetical protein
LISQQVGSSGTYLIRVVNVQEGRQVSGKNVLEDIISRRWLVLRGEIGQRAAEQRHMRYMRITTLRNCDDIGQIIALAPRSDILRWIRMGQICVRDLLRFLEIAQGRRELSEDIALVRFERATGERRSRKAGKQESL